MLKKNIIVFIISVLLYSCQKDIDDKIITLSTKSNLIEKELLLEDLNFLAKTIEEIHPNPYAYIDKKTFYRELDIIKSEINKGMPKVLFLKKVLPLVTSLKDGHTGISSDELYRFMKEKNITRFPYKLEIRDQSAYVITPEEDIISIGSKIISINNVNIEEIINNLATYISGETLNYKEVILEHRFPYLLWLHYGFNHNYKVKYIENGKRKTIKLKGLSIPAQIDDFTSWNSSQNYTYKIIDDKYCYLDFNSFSNYNQFEAFIHKMFREMSEKNINQLIIDIRANGGGNSSLGDLLFSYITDSPFFQYKEIDVKASEDTKKYLKNYIQGNIEKQNVVLNYPINNNYKFNGKTILLTDRFTFSSATSFATLIKDFSQGVIIGEETGGVASSYGDIIRKTLPHSYINFNISSKYFIRPNGNKGLKGVLPDIETYATIGNRLKKYDSTLNFSFNFFTNGYDEKITELQTNNNFIQELYSSGFSVTDKSKVQQYVKSIFQLLHQGDTNLKKFIAIEISDTDIKKQEEILNSEYGKLLDIEIKSAIKFQNSYSFQLDIKCEKKNTKAIMQLDDKNLITHLSYL